MIIKIICSIVIILACIFIGKYYIEKEKYRLRLLKSIQRKIMLLKGIIRYSNSNLIDSLDDIKDKLEVELKEFIEYVILEINKMSGDNFEIIWRRGIEKKLKNTALKECDIEHIYKIGDILGYLDKELQIDNLKLYLEDINNQIVHVEQEIIKKNKLYNTLSIAGGMFLIIIFLN